MDIRLETIAVYPVKSLRGILLPRVAVTPRGLAADRLWVVTDQDGRFLSQRSHPRMARIGVTSHPEGWLLSAPGHPDLVLTPPTEGTRMEVSIWKDRVKAAPAPQQAAAWFSSFLGTPCRLAFMDRPGARPVLDDMSPEGQVVSFADAFPVLAASQASLDLLNAKLEQPVSIDRFRANLVFFGCAPHAEDDWGKFQVGEAVFRAVKPCSRCSVPTVDQETGTVSGDGEPLRTLASYRSQPGGIMFGVNLVIEKPGTVQLGDRVKLMT
jgi:hypothetical protein